ASFIVWLFIRDWRTVLISSIAIPTSIITTFTLIRVMDFTLNSMTLLGLTLAVGIVIDDAIIVLENIYRFIDEKDMPPIQAAVLEWSLRHRWLVVTASLAVFASTFVVNRNIGRDWMPQDDQNELSIYAELPEGSSIEAVENMSRELARKLEQTPGVVSVLPSS